MSIIYLIVLYIKIEIQKYISSFLRLTMQKFEELFKVFVKFSFQNYNNYQADKNKH